MPIEPPAPSSDPTPITRVGPLPGRATSPPAAVDYDGAIWIPAAWYYSGWPQPPSLVVLHCTQPPGSDPCRAGSAVANGRYFARGERRASAHYVVDVRDTVQCVREANRALAAGPTANRRGIHIELCGQTSTDWTTGPGLEVLRRAAPLVASILRRHGLPLVGLDAAALRRGESGMATHAACTEAWHESTHQDPGLGSDRRWPWELWLEMVAAISD